MQCRPIATCPLQTLCIGPGKLTNAFLWLIVLLWQPLEDVSLTSFGPIPGCHKGEKHVPQAISIHISQLQGRQVPAWRTHNETKRA